jgi:hypothetical protein
METTMKNKKYWMILILAITLVLATTTGGWAYLVDTGPSPNQAYNGGWLYSTNNGTFIAFTYYAAEFTLDQDSTITSIEGSMSVGTPGSLRVVIYDDGGDIPGTSLYHKDFSLLTKDSAPTWHGTSELNWTLSSGTYWVAFEVPNPGFWAWMWTHPLKPLGNEAYWNNWGTGYASNDSFDMGVRIDGGALVPLPPTVLLLGSGLLGLVGWRRFRKA